MRLITMNNLFNTPLTIHEKFDLKGSMHNRLVKQEEIKQTPGGVLKDQNYEGKKMFLGDEQKMAFTHQLKIDCEFLVKCNIMDQSLLLGVYNPDLAEANAKAAAAAEAAAAATAAKDAAAAATAETTTDGAAATATATTSCAGSTSPAITPALTPASPVVSSTSISPLEKKMPSVDLHASPAAAAAAAAAAGTSGAVVKPVRAADLRKALLPSQVAAGELVSVFQNHLGGIRAVASSHPSAPAGTGTAADGTQPPAATPAESKSAAAGAPATASDAKSGPSHPAPRAHPPKLRREIYFMGVIDILQEFDLKKKVESAVKGIRFNKKVISAVESKMYADRMIAFLTDHCE